MLRYARSCYICGIKFESLQESCFMKKILFSFLFFCFCLCGFAQQPTVGPIAGINFSTVTGSNGSTKFKVGFRAGAYMKFPFNDVVAFQPEMLYSKIGYGEDLVSKSTDSSISHSLSYIHFPFLLNISVAGGAGFIQLGPQIGYIINAKEKGTILFTNSSMQSQKVDTSNVFGFSTTEYSLVVGGGYKFNFGLSASLHFSYGITKLYTAGSEHNLVISISVMYKLGKNIGKDDERIFRQL